MPVYLRDRESGSFFKKENEWTSGLKNALDLEDRDRAIRVAVELKLKMKKLELVITKQDGTIVLAAPLSKD